MCAVAHLCASDAPGVNRDANEIKCTPGAVSTWPEGKEFGWP
jgi:hypothetical protein